MNKFLRWIIVIVVPIIYGHTALAQTEIIYDFNSGEPLRGLEQVSGSVEVVSLTVLTDNGVANNTPVLHPTTVGTPNGTAVVNLTSFPIASDYTVTWKEYITQGGTQYKKGYMLRANSTGGYTTGIKRGYYFMVQNNATTGSVNFRILNSSAAGIADLRNSGAITIAGLAVNQACWFRASVSGNVLKFEYSLDGITFNVGTSHTDALNLYSSGGTQLVFGIASPVGSYYYDDIKFNSVAKGNSTITVTGASSFIYNGQSQGPKTASVLGSTGTVTYSYSGTGSTVYGPSSHRPILAGTYQTVATVTSDANYEGAMSNPFAFTINSNPEMPIATMRRPLSPSSPMWLIHVDVWAHQPQQVIDLIPPDIRPFVVMNLAMSTSVLRDRGYDCAESWLNTCAQNGIWAMVQPSSGIQNSFASDTALSAYESLYKKYQNFIGYNFCEQAWGFNGTTFLSRLDLFANLLALGHKYGGYLYVNDNFSISNSAFNTISKLKTSAEFANATKVYKDHMIYGDKFTHSWGYYDNESGALGAFLSGHASHYAIRYDMFSWGWSGRGQIFGPEVASDRNPDGNRSLYACPEAVMGVPIVEHMMLTGATVIDGPEVPWMSTVYGPYHLPPFNNMMADILRKVVDGTIRIPTINEVAARTKVAFVNDVNANTTDSLFSGLYAMDGPLQNNRTWFKKSGRYASIPQLHSGDAYETSLFSGATVVKKSEYKTRWPNEPDKIAEFNSLYPVVSKGDMFVSRVNNSLYSYNPWINKDIVTTASIPLKYNTCDSIGLSYPAHTFSVINETSNKLQVYLNNYRTDKNHLWTEYPNDFTWFTLQNTILPQYATNPPDGTFRTSVIKIYGSSSQPSFTLTERGSHKASIVSLSFADGAHVLTVSHNGPVDITIDCAGNATDRDIAPPATIPMAPVQPGAYAGDKQYEAEGGMITSAVVSNTPKRYHGSGFVRFSGATSPTPSSVKFNIIHAETAGPYALLIRYSAQADVTTIDVLVNGTKVSTPTFPATETDSTWAVKIQKVTLHAGAGNTIELKANTSGAVINIDKIILSKNAVPVTPFSFVSINAFQKNSSQIQIDWRVTEELKQLTYEVMKSNDGINFSSIFTTVAKNMGDSYYVNLDNEVNSDTIFYRIKTVDEHGLELYSQVVHVVLKTAIPVQAEAGALGSDWETTSATGLVSVTPKTDLLNGSFPGNASKVITYHVTFERPGTYDLYAKIWVGPGAANDDSFYYGRGFGAKNPLADNNEWITCNNLGGRGYGGQNDVVQNAGTNGINQWKWINISTFNGGETPTSFNVPAGALTQTFQIGSRENGLQFDKFVFGSSNQSFTVRELESLTGPNQVPIVSTGQSFAFSENATSGSIVGIVLASDVDLGTILENWQITGGTGAELFNINPDNGTITLRDSAVLDYEVTTSYTLLLIVSDGLDTSAEQPVTINVQNVNETPVASFIATPNEGFAPLPVSFDAFGSSDPDGDTLSYAWDFGDGSNDIGKVVNHTYTVPGVYAAKLTVDDGLGLSSTSPITIVVNIGLKVQYKVRQNENKTTDNHIKPFFQIVNIGDKAVPYNELTIRYWYTRENATLPWASDNTSQQFWCDYAALGTNKVTGKFVNLASPLNGADYYLEVGFNLTNSLSAGKNSGEIQTRFNNANWSNFNEIDDYSYDPSKISYADWTRATLYRNGQLIWGAGPQDAGIARIANANEEALEISNVVNDWIVYPNPSANGEFTIEIFDFNETENLTLQVMDIQGKQVIHERLENRVFNNSQKLNPGLYFIRMIKSNVTSIKRIAVQ